MSEFPTSETNGWKHTRVSPPSYGSTYEVLSGHGHIFTGTLSNRTENEWEVRLPHGGREYIKAYYYREQVPIPSQDLDELIIKERDGFGYDLPVAKVILSSRYPQNDLSYLGLVLSSNIPTQFGGEMQWEIFSGGVLKMRGVRKMRGGADGTPTYTQMHIYIPKLMVELGITEYTPYILDDILRAVKELKAAK